MFVLGIERTYLYRLTASDLVIAHPSSVNITRFTDIDRLAEIGPYDRAECRGRLRRGDICYAAFVDDELAHYSWVQLTGSHPIDAAAMVVPVVNGEFWIYNCRTAEKHRGKGIYPHTLRRIVSEQFAAGYHTAWIYTSEHNTPSQRGIVRAGFRHYSTMRAFRLGRRHLRLAA